MSSSLVELRPNRQLLDHEFEGYKLTLQTLPHYCHKLESAVDRVYPNDIQYSFVHAKLFALHNHLILDKWDYAFSYYYIDNKQQVHHVTFENTQKTFTNKVVYDVPAHVARQAGHFNLSLSFPSSTMAVLSDGTGYLHIIDTSTRNRPNTDNMWQTIYSTLVIGEGKYFIIIDSRIQEKNGNEIIHCLLQSVEQNDKHFSTVLTWLVFENDGHSWKQTGMRQIQGKGIVHYAAIETNCSAIYIASDNTFKFTLDTENEIKTQTEEKEERKIFYTWLQTSEDITITLQLQEKFDKKLLNINISQSNIKVDYAGKIFIDGKFTHKVDNDLTTWNLQENGRLDILVTKSESMLWDKLIEGDCLNGEQIMDSSLVEDAHRRLAHLCSETEVTGVDQNVPGLSTQELEECDAASEEDTMLVRLDLHTHDITNRLSLSVHQYLSSIQLENQEVPALILRHDVDACVWQPYAQLLNTNTWPMKHQGTLLAFGYVQSSKQNRKFVTCPPNFQYSVVCEASKHIFIYQSSSKEGSLLRKRTGGAMKMVKLGQQHVFNIDKYGEVLGINATNDYLFILTENTLLAIEVI